MSGLNDDIGVVESQRPITRVMIRMMIHERGGVWSKKRPFNMMRPDIVLKGRFFDQTPPLS